MSEHKVTPQNHSVNAEDRLEKLRAKHMEAATDALDAVQGHAWTRSAEICDSEIERLLVVALEMHVEYLHQFGGGSNLVFVAGGRGEMPPEQPPHPYLIADHWIYWICPQVQLGNYRADFILKRSLYLPGEGWRLEPAVVIECDGHNFHERTKEQAKHDRRRDREMQKEGYCVLRFTGSEIWNDPGACAEEIVEFLDQKRA